MFWNHWGISKNCWMGVYLISPKFYVDVPAKPQKFDFLFTNFSLNYSPISIHVLPNFAQIWVPLTIICSKYTQIFYLGSFVSDENPLIDCYTKFCEKASQKSCRHVYLYHVNVRTPCPLSIYSFEYIFWWIQIWSQKKIEFLKKKLEKLKKLWLVVCLQHQHRVGY